MSPKLKSSILQLIETPAPTVDEETKEPEISDTEQPTPAEPATDAEPAPAADAEPAAPIVEEKEANTTAPENVEEVGQNAEAEPKEEVDPAEAITLAPGVGDTQFTTTSIVTTSGTTGSTKKRRRIASKLDAANEFVYGHSEESWTRPERRDSTEIPATFRPNRAQTMRQGCIMKRVQTMERSRRSESDHSQSSSSDSESVDPVTARPVPKSVYGDPKIAIKETKSSKFRYLYNRKPPGVKVYFKPANADQKKKPPFVVSAIHP